MCSKDDNKSRSAKHPMPSRQSSSRKPSGSYAPSYAPSWSRRRSRAAPAASSASAQLLLAADSEDKYGSTKVQQSVCPRITAKGALLVCISGVAWACLIVMMISPAARAPGGVMSSDIGNDVPFVLPGGHIIDGVLPPGWTAVGHHARFMGQKAFPAQFESWGDGGEVVINRVDVGPLSNKTLPRADLLMAILSADTKDGREKRDTMREMYDKYEGWITVGGQLSKGTNKEHLEMSFRVVFIVSSPDAPPEGDLVGDVLYVNAPDGYRNIVHKVKHMMGLVRHVSFKYLLKADDDTFVCMQRLATFLHDQPEESKDKIFAGVPTACNLPTNPSIHVGKVIKDPEDRWYDQKFVHHTLSGLDCFPVYMQGAFYVLAQPLVEHLYRGREHYDTFVNEDVTMGSWLLGVDRALATMHDFASSRLWNCVCGGDYALRPHVRKSQIFFHNCKQKSELRKCSTRMLRPALAC